MLSDIAIQEFQELWLKQYGEYIPKELALIFALKVFSLCKAVYVKS